ncbi:hypothetical protein DFP72DRAFT_758559, partial [Ephemerocybe angulata]
MTELQHALDFIAALKAASLEKSGLDQSVIDQLRQPIEAILDIDDPDDPDLRVSLEVYLATGNASEATYNKVKAAIEKRTPEVKLYTLDRLKRKIGKLTGLIPLVNDMCVNSCMAYTGPFSGAKECNYCSQDRYDRAGKGRQQFYTIPIGPQIQALYANPEMAENM